MNIIYCFLISYYFQYIPLFQFVFSSVFALNLYGSTFYVLFLLQPLIYYIVTLSFKSRLSVWITAGGFLIFINKVNFIEQEEQENYYFAYSTFFWITLKCIAFHLNKVEKFANNKVPKTKAIEGKRISFQSLLNALVYFF